MANLAWSDVVGSRTLNDGGYAGQLLELTMIHLVKAKEDGTLTEAQVGEIYANTIAAAFQNALNFSMNEQLTESKITTEEKQQAILDSQLLLSTKDNTLKQSEVDIVNDSQYVINKLRVITADADTAEAIKDSKIVESQILDEKLITEKETNGGSGYLYVYYFKYYDYQGKKHLLLPQSTTVQGDIPADVTETVTTYVYFSGAGTWVLTNSTESGTYETVNHHFTYYSGNVSDYIHTSVPVVGNRDLLGEAYILKSKAGGWILVSRVADANGDPIVTVSGSYAASFGDLLTDDTNTRARTMLEWSDLYDQFILTPADAKFNDVALFEVEDLAVKDENPFNTTSYVVSELGALVDNDPSGKPNTTTHYSYPCSIDTTEVYHATRTDTADGVKSLVELQKEELIAKKELLTEQATGFKANKKQKLYDKFLDTWGVSFAALPTAANLPTNLNKTGIGNVLGKMYNELNT